MFIRLSFVFICGCPTLISFEFQLIGKDIIVMQKGPNDADLKAVSNKFLEVLKGLEASKEWEEVDDKPVRIRRIEREDRTVASGQITMNLPFQTLANFFNDPTFMKKITDRVANFQILYRLEGLTVIHVHMKGFALVSDRELVGVFTFHRQGNKIYFGNRSCEFPCASYADTVRAFAHCGGYILEKIDENRTKVSNIVDIDMNGSIPGFVKNKLAVMRASILAQLEEKIKATLK